MPMMTINYVSADPAAPQRWFASGSFARAALVAVPAILFAGGIAARVSGSTETNPWYQSLTLPVFQPPGPLFGLAWAVLYTLIGVAFALVWGTRGAPGKRLAIAAFTIGFAINLTWSPLFFRFHMISGALAVLAAMLVVALITTWAFYRVNRLAAWLMLPYVAWLCFAGVLNTRILMLNPMADAMQLGV